MTFTATLYFALCDCLTLNVRMAQRGIGFFFLTVFIMHFSPVVGEKKRNIQKEEKGYGYKRVNSTEKIEVAEKHLYGYLFLTLTTDIFSFVSATMED